MIGTSGTLTIFNGAAPTRVDVGTVAAQHVPEGNGPDPDDET
jgi:hypothetical protein